MTDNQEEKITCVDKLKVGTIVSHHGLKGAMKFVMYIQSTDIVLNSTLYLFNEEEFIANIKVEKISAQTNNHIIWIEGWDNIEKNERYIGSEVYCAKSALPKSDYYYHYELIGKQIIQDERNMGFVNKTHNFGAGDIVENEYGEMFLLDQVDLL